MPSMTAAGTTLAISAGVPATQTSAGYAALTFTTIGGIETVGPIGATYSKVEFKPLNGPIEKHKGSVDYGTLQPSMGFDASDAGQALIKAACDNRTGLYAFKFTMPDGKIKYFQAKVFGAPVDVGDADSIVKMSVTIEINTAPIEHTA